jgi:hypothetical protein
VNDIGFFLFLNKWYSYEKNNLVIDVVGDMHIGIYAIGDGTVEDGRYIND